MPFFILGYLLFSALYSAIASAAGSEQEGQQLAGVVGLLSITPIFLMFPVLNSPDSPLSITLSPVPFLSPVLIFLLISILQPPWPQIALSIVILIISTILLTAVAARIYHRGILMYGRAPRFAEVLRWILNR